MLQTGNKYRLPETFKDSILEKIIDAKIHELIGAQEKLPAECIRDVLDRAAPVRPFKRALMSRSPSIIAEIKRASPSAGLIRADFDAIKVARELQKAGAAAFSVVTEVHHFLGGLENLASLRWNAGLPLLRKDFIIDSYQILEARHAGADAVLLIAGLLDKSTLTQFRNQAEHYGMEALIEIHNEEDLQKAIDAGARLIVVNNRDLRTFKVALGVSLNLSRLLPKDVVAVAEGGIKTADDIHRLSGAGYRGFLVGESLMSAPSPGDALKELLTGRSGAERTIK